MFAPKPRITLFVCILIVLLNFVVVQYTAAHNIKFALSAFIVVLAIVPGVCRRALSVAVVCPCIIAASWLHFHSTVEHQRQFSLLNLSDQHVTICATVCDTAISPSGKRKHVVIDVRSFVNPLGQLNRGKLLLSAMPELAVKPGDYVIARGVIRPPEIPEHKWDFNQASLLNRFDATADFRLERDTNPPPLQIIPIKPRPDFIESLRDQIITTHTRALGKKYGSLLTSMVIGNRNVEVDESVSSSFRNLGLSHMLAASGFNLSIVVATTWSVLRPVICNRIALNLCAGVMMLFYSLLAGMSASIERAAIMCVAMLTAKAFTRSPYLPAVLSLALATTLLADPFAMSDVGLQLSYAATAALLCTTEKIQAATNISHNSILRYAIDIILSCIVAIASILPLQLYYFWQTGLLHLPANAVVAPLVPLITVQGFISSAFACLNLPAAALSADYIISIIIKLLMLIVDCFNSAKWSMICTGPPSVHAIIFYYASLLSLCTCTALRFRAAVSASLLIAAAIGLLYRPPMPPLTVIKMRQTVIAIDSQRNALVVGENANLQVRRCLSFFATKPVNASTTPTGMTECMQWETTDTALLIIIRATHRQVRISRNPRYNYRHSVVRVYH